MANGTALGGDDDDVSGASGSRWHLRYGGEVQWLDSGGRPPELICLHSLQNEQARKVSRSVLSGHVVQYTSLEQALQLVRDEGGHPAAAPSPEDFWLFGGYVGWGPGQLQDELERRCWYVVATDASTVWEELRTMQRQQQQDSDYASKNKKDDIVGADMWARLMQRIGRGDEAHSDDTEFDDMMLREWTREHLLLDSNKDDGDDAQERTDMSLDNASLKETIAPGTLLRGSSAERSPFLLSEQAFHKSIVLVTQDEEHFTVGLLLNHPSSDLQEFASKRKDSLITVPIRYGGRFGLKGDTEKPTFWFHNSPRLRDSRVGSPLQEVGTAEGIWKCTREQVRAALLSGIATEKDFLCVRGITVWPKIPGTGASLVDDMERGRFELVPMSRTNDVWDALRKQEVTTTMTMDRNLLLGRTAWDAARGAAAMSSPKTTDGTALEKLCDDALKRWVAAYLLGEPYLCDVDTAFGSLIQFSEHYWAPKKTKSTHSAY